MTGGYSPLLSMNMEHTLLGSLVTVITYDGYAHYVAGLDLV